MVDSLPGVTLLVLEKKTVTSLIGRKVVGHLRSATSWRGQYITASEFVVYAVVFSYHDEIQVLNPSPTRYPGMGMGGGLPREGGSARLT